MYGNKPPAARRLAQLPQKYADGGMVARMKSADAGPATFGARGLSQLRDLIPQMQAMGYPQQAPAAAAPAAVNPRAAQLQAMIPRVEAMGYQQLPQRLAAGGVVRGPGTGTSDSIATEAEPGTFIMPADSTKAIGPRVLAQMGKKVPVRLSNGEYELPPAQVMGLGAAVLEALKDSTHEATEAQEEGRAAQKLASGGMVENDVTRVGNSYSGGNVGGSITVNGDATAGTFSENPAGRMAAMPAAAPTAAPSITPAAPPPAAAAMAAPTTAPQPSMPGWSDRNAERNADVAASSIMNRPEWSKTPVKSEPTPAAPTPPAPPPVDSRVAQPASTFQSKAAYGVQPRRYADGGTVKDETRALTSPSALYMQDRAQELREQAGAGNYAQAAGTATRTAVQGLGMYGIELADKATTPLVNAVAGFGRGLVGGASAPAPAPAPQPALSLAGAGRGVVAPPAVNPSAPRPTAPPAGPSLTSAAAALSSGVPSAQNNDAAESLARRGAAFALAQMPNAPAQVSAPIARNSTNDWAARNNLRNLAVSASSITNDGGRFDRSGKGDSAAVTAYKAALGADIASQQSQPGLDAEAMRQNANLQRETIQQQGLAARDSERNAISRDELGLRKTAAGFQNRAAARMENLGNVLLDPNATPEQRKVAQRSLVALSGKSAADRMQVVNLPDTDNGQGQVLKGGQALVRTLEDGTVEQVPIGGQQGGAKPQPLNNHVAALKANPGQAAFFDEIYGKGAAAKALKGG